MKKLLLAASMLTAATIFAQADTLLDPLHGTVCSGVGTGCTNLDNGSFVPFTQSNFGFEISGPISPATGNLTLVFGVPTDEINTGTFNLPGLTETVGGVGGSVSTSVFSRTSFYNSSSTGLAVFLGLASDFSPTDNFSNLSTGVSGVDSGFNGSFLLLTATIPSAFLDAQGSTTLTDDFSFGSNLPAGTFIAGLFTMPASECSMNCDVGTAASSHLVVTPHAVPGPIVGAGIPGLAALFMLGLARLRQKRNVWRNMTQAAA